MIAVAMVDSEWAIGSNGNQPIHLKNDLARFKKLTEGKTVIYGSRTLETFPDKKPLPGRKNILVSHKSKKEFDPSIDELYSSIDDLLQYIDTASDDIIVIGGSSIYHQLIPYCNQAVITRVNTVFENADVFFPRIDRSCAWICHIDHDGENLIDYDTIDGSEYTTTLCQYTFDKNKYSELSNERLVMNWVDININLLMNGDGAELFISELGGLCVKLGFDIGFSNSSAGSYTDPASRMGPVYRAVKFSDSLWTYACAHIESMYQLELQRLGVLILLYAMRCNEVLTRAIMNYTEDLDHNIQHTSETGSQISLLKKYFETLQTLGTYKTDPSQYVTDTERNLHKELIHIYADLMK